jgi:hypothetical protein
MRREQVGKGYASSLHGPSQDFSIDAVILSSVIADANFFAASGVHQKHLVAPIGQLTVNEPGLAARFNRNASRRLPRAEQRLERLEGSDGRASHDRVVLHLAISYRLLT